MYDTREEVRAYMRTFRGPGGKCARLGQLRYLIDSGNTEGGGDRLAVSGGSVSRDGVFARAASLSEQVDEANRLEDEIGHVGSLLRQVDHGDMLDSLYLVEDVPLLSALASEYGVSKQTIVAWQNRAFDQLAYLL